MILNLNALDYLSIEMTFSSIRLSSSLASSIMELIGMVCIVKYR
jgi:hypothetical protein